MAESTVRVWDAGFGTSCSVVIVAQVVDFGKGSVHTTWIAPDGKLTGFQGKVKSLEERAAQQGDEADKA